MLGRRPLRLTRMRTERSRTGFSSPAFFGLVAMTAVAACSSPSPPPKTPPGLTCSAPGEATPGPADTHCAGQPPQAVSVASCLVDADAGVAASGDDACDYGPTMFGATSVSDGGLVVTQGDDDDCKYHVAWTSTPICDSSLPVAFTVTVTSLVTGLPVTDIPATEGILPEAFIPTTLDAACDTMTTHASPTAFGDAHLYETTPTSGVYFGQIIFDQPGEWTLRFHIHEECFDSLPDSPHGHAAFHVTVP